MGVTLQKLAKKAEAESCYREAIRLKPDYAGAYLNLGNTLKDQGRFEEAEEDRKAIEKRPDVPLFYINLGNILKLLDRFDEAEASHRKAIELNPDYAEAQFNLGNTLKQLDRLHDAKESYKKAIALKADYAVAHNNLGATLYVLSSLQEAESSYRKGLKLSQVMSMRTTIWAIRSKKWANKRGRSVFGGNRIKHDFVDARFNLGVLLFESKQYVMAARQFDFNGNKESKLYAIRCPYLRFTHGFL